MATPLPRTPPSRDASPARVRGGAGCCGGGGGGGRSASPRRVPSEVVQECLRRCRERRQAREAAAQQATPSRTALRPDAQRCPASTPPRALSPNVRWELGIHATGPVAVSAPAAPQRRTRSADHGAGPLFSTPRSPLASPRAPSPGQRIPLPCGSCGGGGAQSPGRRPASAGGCGILDVSFLPGMASKPGCGSCPYGETTRKPKGPAQDPRSNLCYIGQQAHRMNPATFAGLLFNDVIPEQATGCEASCGNREGAFPPRARGMEVPQPAPPPGSAGSPGRGRSPQRGGSPAGARRLGSPARPAPAPRGVDLSGARGKRPCSSKCPSNKGGDSPARGSTAAGDAVPGAIFVHRLTPVSPHERSRSPVVQVEMPGRGLVHFTGDALMFGRAIALGGGAGGGQAGAGLPEPWASIVQRFHDTIATVIKQYGDLAESNDRADRLRNCQEDLSRLQNEVSMTMQNLQDGQASPELAAVAARLQPLGQAARHLQEQCEGLLQLEDAGERLPSPALRPPPDFPWSGGGGCSGGGGGGGATPMSVNVSVHSHRSSSETPCPAGGYGYRTPGAPCAERSQPSPAGAPVAAYVTREKHGGRSRTNVVVRFRPDEVAGPSSGGAGGGAEGVEPRSFLESLLRQLRERAGRSTGECDACAQQAQDLIGRLHAVTEIAKNDELKGVVSAGLKTDRSNIFDMVCCC